MRDSDQRPDSNRRTLLKLASSDVIISNNGPMKRYSQINVLSKLLDLWPIYWLGLGFGLVIGLRHTGRHWTSILRK